MEKYEYSEIKRELLDHSMIPFAVYQFIDNRIVPLVLSDGFCELFLIKNKALAMENIEKGTLIGVHKDDEKRLLDSLIDFETKKVPLDIIYRYKLNWDDDNYKIIHAKAKHTTSDDGTPLGIIWYTDEGCCTSDFSEYDKDFIQSISKALKKESFINSNNYDPLTGLPSMTYFLTKAEEGCTNIIKNGGIPTIAYFDISGMNHYNQNYGFSKGDDIIRAFARLLTRYFSTENCCHFAQDHFALYTNIEDPTPILKKLFSDWDKINKSITLPIRVGIYSSKNGFVDITLAVDKAKIACDKLKSTYFSSINVFDDSLQKEMDRLDYVVRNIDKAIENRWIKVYYQPIIRAANGRVCDEEALVRWIDPEKGFFSPGEFIPVLEETGLIYKIDLYVVDRVIEKLAILKEEGLHLVPQSINLSRTDFEACDIVEEIRSRIDDAGLSRDMFTIEITESIIASNFEYMKSQIEKFRKLGFKVWMDDFGSGYSSLDVLQSLDFDLIKFDMKFLQNIDEGPNGKIILSELLKMATSLGVDTICEGVETKEHVRFLRECGCSKLQGYYYTSPLPVERILERYRTGIQIGFENPAESDYYEALGKINLYDLSSIAVDADSDSNKYYNALPASIMEIMDDQVLVTRSNPSFREFMKKHLGYTITEEYVTCTNPDNPICIFIRSVVDGIKQEPRILLDQKLPSGYIVHIMVNKITENPVTHSVAISVAVLSITDPAEGATYEKIARTLAKDFTDLFYVNLRTDDFYHYTSRINQETVNMERTGTDFFNQARTDSMRYLYKEDRPTFAEQFTKENVLHSIAEHGSFTLSYRIMENGKPVYVHMKSILMGDGSDYIIFGVSNIDAQMKREMEYERFRKDEETFTRISALAGNYICIYTVDLEDDSYVVFTSDADYDTLNIPREGPNFFIKDIVHVIHPDDLQGLVNVFTKENILSTIEKNGIFEHDYRLMIKGAPVKVRLKAAIVDEKDGKKLIVGVNRLS